MLDHKEGIQHVERHGGHGEEVECGDHFAMVLQKGQPLPAVAEEANANRIDSSTARTCLVMPPIEM
jgi:hypothetical protein